MSLSTGRQILTVALVLGLLVACIEIEEEQITSSEWVDDFCVGLERLDEDFSQSLSDLVEALGSTEAALALDLSSIYLDVEQIAANLLARTVVAGERVPEEDSALHSLLLELVRTLAASLSDVADALRVLERLLGEPFAETDGAVSALNAVFGSLQAVVTEQERLLAEIEMGNYGAPLAETIARLDRCNVIARGQPEAACLLVPTGCEPSDGERPTDVFEPWSFASTEAELPEALSLSDVGLLGTDFSGEGFEVLPFSEKGEGPLTFLHTTLASGCPSREETLPPIPSHPAAEQYSMGMVTRPGVDPGMMIYVVEEFESADVGAQAARSVQVALARCGASVDDGTSVIARLGASGDAPQMLTESVFGGLFDQAAGGAAELVWLAEGPYLALVLTDAYGIGIGGLDGAVDALANRMQSAALILEE